MRKTSQDGGDSYSITSGVEIELKKPLMSLLKSKKGSLKRKPPNSSKETDETVVEPLLNRDHEKPGTSHSAKFFTKPKTDADNDNVNDKSKLINDSKIQNTTSSPIITSVLCKENALKSVSTAAPPIHNYMNTNVFNTHDSKKVDVTPKSQILVEIDNSKPSGYNPSPLIFTTAKIHTDGKTKQMEPVQVTPVPILSTVEANLSKNGNITTNEKKVMNASNGAPLISTVYNTNIISKSDSKPNTQSNTVASAAQTNDTDKSIATNQSKTPTTSLNNSIMNQPHKSNNLITTTKTETKANNQQKEMTQKPPVTIIPSNLDLTKVTISSQTSKSVIQSQPTVSTSTKDQNNKAMEKTIDKNNTIFESVQIVDCQPKQVHSNKNTTDSSTAPVNTSAISKSDIKTSESDTQVPKNSLFLDDTLKTKKTPVATSVKTPEKAMNTDIKIVSSSIKQPISTSQSKENNINLSKEQKTPKSSANDLKRTISKPVQHTANTLIKSTDKTPAISASNTATNIKMKTQPLNTKAITTTASPSNLPKSVTTKSITLTKTAPLTVSSKSTTATSTKSTTKVTSVTSQKPSGIAVTSSAAAVKHPTASTVKTSTSASVTKTTPSTSNLVVTTKSSASKTAQASAKSETTAKVTITATSTTSAASTNSAASATSVTSATAASTTAVTSATSAASAASTNGIVKSNGLKKVTKPNDITSTKVSKA